MSAPVLPDSNSDSAAERSDAVPTAKAKKPGRNLLLAITIGLLLGVLFLLSLLIVKELFILFAGLIVALGTYEFATALRLGKRDIPRFASVASAVFIVPASYYFGPKGQLLALGLGIIFVVFWRILKLFMPKFKVAGSKLLPDFGVSVLVQLYLPFLMSFALLLLANPGGEYWLITAIVTVVAVDTSAYAVGSAIGKTPMVPKISPTKTWEGFLGSVCGSLIMGQFLGWWLLDLHWWQSVLLSLALVASATVGDLTESLLKRSLKIKDMSSWLPGHGGFMDRLDSLLPSAFVVYCFFLAIG